MSTRPEGFWTLDKILLGSGTNQIGSSWGLCQSDSSSWVAFLLGRIPLGTSGGTVSAYSTVCLLEHTLFVQSNN